MIDYQYIEQVKEGCSLHYCGRVYRVQNDKGWMFVFATVEGKRKKIGIEKVQVWFEYGSYQDWVFNNWYQVYSDYEIFKQYADVEKMAA